MGRRYGKRIYHMVDTSRCGVEEQDGCLHSIARERAEFQKKAKKRLEMLKCQRQGRLKIVSSEKK
jgi:hypothetical protein